MPIQCKYCSAELPKENARFCNKCGMLVPSHPLSPQSLSALKKDAKPSTLPSIHPDQPEMSQDKLPETPQPVGEEDVSTPPVAEEPIAHKQESTPVRPRHFQIAQQSPAWPVPMTHISMKEAVAAENKAGAQHAIPATPVNKTPVHPQEFEQNRDIEMYQPTEREKQVIEEMPTNEMAVPGEETPKVEGVDVEEMPTSALAVPGEEMPTEVEEPPTEVGVEEMPTSALAAPGKETPEELAAVPIEELPTRHIAVVGGRRVPAQEPAVEMLPTSALAAVPFEQLLAEEAAAQAKADSPLAYTAMAAYGQAEPSAFPKMPVPSPPIAAAPTPMPVHPTRPARSRRGPLIIGALLLVVLISGGVVAWVYIAQPFNIAPITQPQVSFSDGQRGIALRYPNGWIKQLTADTVQFYASNHTADMDITVAAPNSNLSQALQQEAAKLNVSGTKAGTALTFAGETWQQLQGTVQQKGANYTNTMLATTHGGHLFIVMQQAPQGNYTDWEKEFFAPMRSSFKFL